MPMNSFVTDLSALVAVVEKAIPEVLEVKDALVKVLNDLKPGLFTAASGAQAEQIASLCSRAEIACNSHLQKVTAGGEVGAFGGGQILSVLLAIVLKLLPLFIMKK